MSFVSSTINKKILEYKNCLFDNLQLLKFSSNTQITRDLFDNSNQIAFREIIHFLLYTYDPKKCDKLFGLCWPVYDKRQEKEFSQIAKEYILNINKNEPNALLGSIMPSFFVCPYGFKIYRFLAKLSRFILHKQLNMENIHEHFGIQKELENNTYDSEEENYKQTLINVQTNNDRRNQLYHEFINRSSLVKCSLENSISDLKNKISILDDQILTHFKKKLTLDELENLLLIRKEDLWTSFLELKRSEKLSSLLCDLNNVHTSLKEHVDHYTHNRPILDAQMFGNNLPLICYSKSPFTYGESDGMSLPEFSNGDQNEKLNLNVLLTLFIKQFNIFKEKVTATQQLYQVPMNNDVIQNLINQSNWLKSKLLLLEQDVQKRLPQITESNALPKCSPQLPTSALIFRLDSFFDSKNKFIENTLNSCNQLKSASQMTLEDESIDIITKTNFNERVEAFRKDMWMKPKPNLVTTSQCQVKFNIPSNCAKSKPVEVKTFSLIPKPIVKKRPQRLQSVNSSQDFTMNSVPSENDLKSRQNKEHTSKDMSTKIVDPRPSVKISKKNKIIAPSLAPSTATKIEAPVKVSRKPKIKSKKPPNVHDSRTEKSENSKVIFPKITFDFDDLLNKENSLRVDHDCLMPKVVYDAPHSKTNGFMKEKLQAEIQSPLNESQCNFLNSTPSDIELLCDISMPNLTLAEE